MVVRKNKSTTIAHPPSTDIAVERVWRAFEGEELLPVFAPAVDRGRLAAFAAACLAAALLTGLKLVPERVRLAVDIC